MGYGFMAVKCVIALSVGLWISVLYSDLISFANTEILRAPNLLLETPILTRWMPYKQPQTCSQEHRKVYIKELCRSSNLTRINSTNERFLIDVVNRIAYCVLPKIGCTTMKTIMVNISTQGQLRSDMNLAQLRSLHLRVGGNSFRDRGLIYTKSYAPYMDNYTKLLIVRHPMQRIVSAFYDKMQGNDIAFKGYAYSIARHFGNASQPNSFPTFSEFVRMITNASLHMSKNMHWDGYFYACDPCRINYDYILKMETMQSDLEYFITQEYGQGALQYARGVKVKINASPQLQKYNFSETSHHRQSLLEYSELSSKELSKVLLKFKNELDFFGYSFNQDFVPRCEYSNDIMSGDMCC